MIYGADQGPRPRRAVGAPSGSGPGRAAPGLGPYSRAVAGGEVADAGVDGLVASAAALTSRHRRGGAEVASVRL